MTFTILEAPPKSTFRVGDKVTGEQADALMNLPDGKNKGLAKLAAEIKIRMTGEGFTFLPENEEQFPGVPPLQPPETQPLSPPPA